MRRLRLLSSIGLGAIGILMGSQAALSGGQGGEGWVRYKPDYEGYHLRPPYYLPDLGWYTPPTSTTDHFISDITFTSRENRWSLVQRAAW